MKNRRNEVKKMKQKMRFKQFLSGMMAVVTLLSSAITPVTAYAAEPENKVVEYPTYEQVKDELDAEEVVTATDYEVEKDSGFDVECDFTGIEILDDNKVKVTFHEAKNEAGEDFTTDHTDTYQAVYYVEPVSGHPTYQIQRNLVVKEPVLQPRQEAKESVSKDGPAVSLKEPDSEEELGLLSPDKTVEAAEEKADEGSEETAKEIMEEEAEDIINDVSEATPNPKAEAAEEPADMTVDEVMQQADEQGIDLMGLGSGESISFYATTSANTAQQVTVTRGDCYYYETYGYGTYLTYKYIVNFGDITATAYCIQPSVSSPGSGVYSISKLGDSKALAKVCYYGTNASGENGYFAEKHPEFSEGQKFILIHMAASYANGSSDAFNGASAAGKQLAMELYNYCIAQPEIPDVAMSFSNDDVTAYISGTTQRTESITFKADELQTITLKLPDGVKLHNETTGKTSAAGADVEISGGTKFYLTAPLSQAADISTSWSATMKGSITKDYSAYKITTGADSQDLALVFGEGVTDEKYISLSVKWLELVKVKVVKKDVETGNGVAGAIYGVYSDSACTKLLETMPKTDANGSAEVEFIKQQDKVYVKEITASANYLVSTESKGVTVSVKETATATMTETPAKGEIEVLKKDTETGSFKAQGDATMEGAVYGLYAKEDIVHPDGHTGVVYPAGTLVAKQTFGVSGEIVFKNLYFGFYYVKEISEPVGYLLDTKEYPVRVTYKDQNTAVVVEGTTVLETVKKQAFEIIKISADGSSTETVLVEGAEFTVKLESDVKANGWVNAKTYDTLVTDAKGYAKSIELPYGTYRVKETRTPADMNTTKDFYVTVSEDSRTPQVWRVFNDAPFQAYIRLIKKDVDTGEIVQIGGTTFKIRNVQTGEDVSMKVGNQHITTFTTDETGMVTTPLMMQPGDYEVYEITAPFGYVVKTEAIPFTVTSKGEYHTDEDGDFVVDVEIINTQQYGNVHLNKHGEALTSVSKEGGLLEMVKSLFTGKDRNLIFTYEDLPIEGSVFHLICDEDIYTADNQSNEDGSRKIAWYQGVELKKGAVAAILTTDKDGKATAERLPLRKYHIEETKASQGYVLNETQDAFTLEYAGQDVELVYHDSDFENERQKTALSLIKTSTKEEKTVEGAAYGLYAKEDIISARGDILVEADALIETETTDADGKIAFMADLPLGTYYVKEVEAAPGYLLDKESYEVDFSYQGQGVKVIANTLEVKDEPTITEISKTDITTGEEIEGAKLQILDQSGEVVEEWTSTGEKHIVYGLPAGDYILRETMAPTEQGYVKAEDVSFTIGESGEVQKVEMKDDYTKVSISKVDMTDGSTEVEGVRLYILDEDNKVIESWVSTKEAHYIEKLPVGTYSLLEEMAPKGYIISNKVSFEVKETGEIQTVTMEDAHAMGKIILNKTDKDTQKPMQGVEFTIYDSRGKELETLITDSAGHAESKEYPIAAFKSGKYGKQLTYTVKETKTLEGYKLDETKHKVKFEYVDDKTPVIEYTLDVTNEKIPDQPDTPSKTTTSTPKTGDDSNIGQLLLLMGISAGGAGLLFWKKKRRK